MKIEYYHKNIDHLTQPSRDFIEEKLQHLDEMCTNPQLRIEIDKNKKGVFHMHARLDDNGSVYNAEAEENTIEVCIESVRDELKRQVTHTKEKDRDLERRRGRSLKKALTIDDKARL